jgi:hypothetical protein
MLGGEARKRAAFFQYILILFLFLGGVRAFVPRLPRHQQRVRARYMTMAQEAGKPRKVLMVCLGNICRSPAVSAVNVAGGEAQGRS